VGKVRGRKYFEQSATQTHSELSLTDGEISFTFLSQKGKFHPHPYTGFSSIFSGGL